jgi:hypothetical protein
MEILDSLISFVNEQISFHDRRAKWLKGEKPQNAKKHAETAEVFRQLHKFLLEKNEEGPIVKKKPPKQQLKLSLTPAEIEGLPEELMQELSISSADKAEYAILNLMEEAGGIMSLDQILVGLYKATKEVHKRQTLTSRLYRMAQRNQVFSVPSKKGVYSLEQLTDTEVAKLMDGEDLE